MPLPEGLRPGSEGTHSPASADLFTALTHVERYCEGGRVRWCSSGWVCAFTASSPRCCQCCHTGKCQSWRRQTSLKGVQMFWAKCHAFGLTDLHWWNINKKKTAEGHLEAFCSYYKWKKCQPPPTYGGRSAVFLEPAHWSSSSSCERLEGHSDWISAIKCRNNAKGRGGTIWGQQMIRTNGNPDEAGEQHSLYSFVVVFFLPQSLLSHSLVLSLCNLWPWYHTHWLVGQEQGYCWYF